MRKTSIRTSRHRVGLLQGVLVAALGILGGTAQPASATILEYELEGFIKAPIHATNHGRPQGTAWNFQQHIDRGDLILTLDTDTGSASIDGRTFGCVAHNSIGRCQVAPAWRFSADKRAEHNIFYGQGYFDWNLELTGGRERQDANGTTGFLFGMQNAGNISLINPRNGVPRRIGVMAKAEPNAGYAFGIFEGQNTTDGIIHLYSWLLNSGGVLGGFARTESAINSGIFNSHLRGYLRTQPPGSEVPEPSTLLLLGSGIAAVLRRSKR